MHLDLARVRVLVLLVSNMWEVLGRLVCVVYVFLVFLTFIIGSAKSEA